MHAHRHGHLRILHDPNGTGPHTDQTVTLNADGTVPNSAMTAAFMAGSYSYIGVYSGDSNYAGIHRRRRAPDDQPGVVEREHDDL